MTFAAILDRANSALRRHLLTDVAVLDHVEIGGAYRCGFQVAMDAISAQVPTFTVASADCANVEPGVSRLRIHNVGSFLVQQVEPDGAGMAVLRLQAVVE